MRTYTLTHTHDVWGNAQDGWEVNNQYIVCDDLVIAEDASQYDVMQALKRMGFLAKHVRLNMLDFLIWDIDMIEICIRRNGKPLCYLTSDSIASHKVGEA